MRQIRMVGLAALVVFVVSAVGVGTASAEKAPKYTANTYAQYKYCPYDHEERRGWCYTGITSGGSKGGFFQFGKVKVPLNKPITLHGGYNERGNIEPVETEEEEEQIIVFPATHGGQTLEAPELKVTGGISLLNKTVQMNQGWPAALVESWKEAKKNHEGNVYAKIELAGNELFEVPDGLSTTNLVLEKGTAFRLPLKVKITSPWLEKLGSGPCYIGTDAHPVHINLTSGGAGSAGTEELAADHNSIILRNSRLVDLGWTIEPESAPTGCGGMYESYIDNSLSQILEIGPNKTGIVVLQGTLYTGDKQPIFEKGIENGELP